MTFNNSKLIPWVLSAIVLALVALLALNVYYIRLENEETSQLLLLVDKSAEEESLAQSVRSFQKNAKSELEEFDNIAVSDNNLIGAIEKIESTARRLGLESEIVVVDKTEEAPPRIRITLDSVGSWQKTFLLLAAIENLPYRVILERATLSKGKAQWRSTITLLLYLFDDYEGTT